MTRGRLTNFMAEELYTVTIYTIGVSHTFEGEWSRNPYMGNCWLKVSILGTKQMSKSCCLAPLIRSKCSLLFFSSNTKGDKPGRMLGITK